MTSAQQRVHALVKERATVTSIEVANELSWSRSWACHCLCALVRKGIVDVRNGEGGTYEWTAR